MPYEKVGKNEPVCIVDEVPFEIPDSWEWVRLTTLGEIVGGGTPKTNIPEYWDKGNIPWLTPADMKFVTGKYVDKGERCITEEGLKGSSAHMMPAGTIVYSSRAPIGYIAIASTELCTNQGFKSLVPVLTCIDDYVYYCLIAFTPEIQSRASGTTFKEISGAEFGKTLIPLPPLAEQQRIVKRIEDVLPALKTYDTKETALRKMNGDFPDKLRKSILQWAVQGKLVPQDPTDEPAEMLLERIRAEKQRLVKEGKIKKDKHESAIFRRDNSHYEKRGSEEVCIDDEIPFEIPENWAWARLSSFGVFSSGKTPSMSNPQFWNGDIPWVTSKDMKRPVITDSEMHITKLAASTMQLYPAGTLLLVARSGILKRLLPLCTLGIDSTINQDIKAFKLYDIDISEWLYYGIKAFEPYILKELVKSVTTVESLKFDEFSSMLLPVPPLAEQHRIISAIKAMLNLLAPLSNNPLFSL